MSDDWQNDRTRRERAELIDATAPNVARIADFLQGGRDNFEADRKAVRAMIAIAPITATLVPAARAFHRRMVRYLAAEAGIRQFVDIGAGLATSGCTHELVQSIDPTCRIVYVDDDPMALTHLRALSKSTPEGGIDYLEGHLADPGTIMAGARATLDFTRPIAVLLLSSSTLGLIIDTRSAAAAVSALIAAVPSGSYIALYHQAVDLHPELHIANRRWNQLSSKPATLRSKDEVASFLAGLELIPPGLVPVCDWHPAPDDPHFDEVVPLYGVVGRKR